MSNRPDVSQEQPRKKQRLTGPEDLSIAEVVTTNIASPDTEEEDAITSVEEATKAQLEQEQNAGITVWATDAPGFTGIVKKRYTDFLVNEINLNKHVIHLEDIAKPPDKKPQKPKNVKKNPTETQSGEGVTHPTTEEKTGEEVSVKKEKTAAEVAVENAAKNEEASAENRKNAAIAAISEVDMKTLHHIFGEKMTKELCTLYGKVCSRPGRKARDFNNLQSDVISDKQKRTDAHIACRRIFSGLIETMTGDDNSIHAKACPSAASSKPRNSNDVRQGGVSHPKGKVGWDELGGEYLHFTLYKENKDTMEVLYFMASQLKLHIKNFQYAGTKDRRGVTVQRVAAFRIPAERLQNLNRMLRAARMGGFKNQPHGLELGDLYGNEFTITLRDCAFPDAPSDFTARLEHAKRITHAALTNFQETGFINYYGLQRFGSFSIGTDEIGKRMLQGDLEGAVNLLCTYSPAALAAAQAHKAAAENGTAIPEDVDTKISQDDMARAEALHIWTTEEKMAAALDKMPRRFQAETAIIRHLGWVDKRSGEFKRRKDFQGALMGIARNLRLMYVHAYQSLVWNMAAGKRWESFGKTVVEGDLVLVNEHKDKETKAEDAALEQIDEDGEVIIRPALEDSATTQDERFERARALTKEEAESGKYTIFDLVLPLPGFDVVYPPNSIGAYYKEFMGSEKGGKLDPMDMRRKWKDISLSGSYRKIMARPEAVSWEVRAYSKDDEQMVQTDLEKLLGKKETEKTRSAAASGYGKAEGTAAATDDAVDAQAGADVETQEQDGKQEDTSEQREKIAVVLKMQLGSSQYATMALRELSKGGAITYKPDFQGAR